MQIHPNTYTLFLYPLSVLAIAFFIVICPKWDRSEIHKQGCDLTKKGHGNGILV